MRHHTRSDDIRTTVLFFDVTSSGMRRLPAQISRYIQEQAPETRTVAGYLIEDVDPSQDRESIDRAEHVTSQYRAWLQRHSPNVVVLFSHRIPDLILLAVGRSLSVPTIMVQHGIYVEMEYGPSAYFTEKALRYLRLLPELAWESDIPRRRMLKPWALQERSDRADQALVYGTGYVEYFAKHYGYSPSDCSVVGYPDYDGWQAGPPEPGVCYIAQSLVEDGRVSRSRFEGFVRVLAALADETSLSVKLHPRSDLSLYEPLIDRSVPMVRHDDLPLRDIYISHSTTLLAKAFRISPRVLLWSFPSVVVPQFFCDWAIGEYSSRGALLDAVRRLQQNDSDQLLTPPENIDRWFERNEDGAISTISRHILTRAAG